MELVKGQVYPHDGASILGSIEMTDMLANSTEYPVADAATAALRQYEEYSFLADAGAALARSVENSVAGAAAAAVVQYGGLNLLADAGAKLARSVEFSVTSAAANALVRPLELESISGYAAALACSVENSVAGATAAAIAQYEGTNLLADAGVALARSVEFSVTSAAANALVRPPELDCFGGYATALAYSSEISVAGVTAAALAQFEEIRSLTSSNFIAGSSRPSHLSQDAHSAELYSPIVAELNDCEFEDAYTPEPNCSSDEYDGTAMRATYERACINAEFTLSFTLIPAPIAIEAADSRATFNPQHWQILNELEQRLRQEVEQCLKTLSGSSWIKQRVPQAVRERWLERQEEDRAAGRPVYDAIQYADFMDLADIIKRKNNWREVFQPIFKDANDIAVSLQRLHPVRKALAHSRPLSRTDVLTLVSEATHVFSALGVRVLH